MKPVLRIAICALALTAAAAPPPRKDVFDFVPPGGRTLLAGVLSNRASPAEARAILGGKHTSDEWLVYLAAHESALPSLKTFDAKKRRTLADYLAANMPLAKPPADPAKAAWAKVLPPDGRDFALEKCQGCHIITVVITQDRSKAAWLGTLHKPSHIGIKLSQPQREALVNYLLVNGAIPIDQVPEELRAGGATY